MRSYPRRIHDRRSEAQLEQRSWFVEAVRFASRLVEVLRVGLRQPALAMRLTEGNLFVKANKHLFGMAGGRLAVDYRRLVLSDGSAAPVGFGPLADAGGGRELTVDFSFNPQQLPCSGGDKVYLVAIGAGCQEADWACPPTGARGP